MFKIALLGILNLSYLHRSQKHFWHLISTNKSKVLKDNKWVWMPVAAQDGIFIINSMQMECGMLCYVYYALLVC